MHDEQIPDIIRVAGDAAISAYQEFLDDPMRKPSTQRVYRQYILRFCRWAEKYGLTLETITVGDVGAYAAWINPAIARRTVDIYLTPVRGLFQYLIRNGVCSNNPCGSSPSSVLQSRRNKSSGHAPQPGPAGFPLLDLLAMLSHMEERTLSGMFDIDEDALLLLEQVRWPDKRTCPHCGVDADCDPSELVTCRVCAKPYRVTTGTLFERESVPPRHWLFLAYQMFLADSPLPDDKLERSLGLDGLEISFARLRLSEAFTHEGLEAGMGLKPVLEKRNRELGQEQVIRDILHYGELTSVRDRLVKAKAEGTPVEDLPPGMGLEEAIEKLEARIAEEDRYVIAKEDGYLVRYVPEPDAPAEILTEQAVGECAANAQVPSDAR